MGIFRRLSRLFGSKLASAPLEAFLAAARDYRCEDNPHFVTICESSPEEKAAIAIELCRLFLPEAAKERRRRDILFRPAIVTLWIALCEAELPFATEQIVVLIDGLARGHVSRHVEGVVDRALLDPVDETIVRALEELRSIRPNVLTERMRELLPEPLGDRPPAVLRKPAKAANPVEAWLARVETDRTADWTALLEAAQAAPSSAKPSKRFLTRTGALVDAIGSSEFEATLLGWLDTTELTPTYEKKDKRGIPDDQRLILRGLIWASGPIMSEPLAGALAAFAIRAFRKITYHGPTDAKLGNAALIALGQTSGAHGVGALAAVSAKVGYSNAKRKIDRVLNEAAGRAGVTREELEEAGVPDFGLRPDGSREQVIGNYVAEVVLVGTDAKLRWRNQKGRTLKSVPKPIREEHKETLKSLRREVKDLDAVAKGQRARLERLWLSSRVHAADTLRQHTLEHALVGLLARRLLWSVERGGSWQPVLYRDGAFWTLADRVEVADDARVRLWHPIDADSSEEVAVWRDWLCELGIAQPFAQLYREVYAPTHAATDERFGGHVLLQHALREQCRIRGWTYQVQGYFDSYNEPTLELAAHDLVVSLVVEPIRHRSDEHLFQYVQTGAVSFSRQSVTEGERRPTPLLPRDVDPLVFSEVMRAVGAIVSTATIAVDPGFNWWTAGGEFSEIWQRGAWGDLTAPGLARRQVLIDILARTTLRDTATIDGRWLVVDGTSGSRRIHLGSGLVRDAKKSKPVEVRLTSAAKRAAAEVFMPFEGDAILKNILARAFVLAE